MADKLTIKQEKFAQGLFAGLSQREAYKQAYNCSNMTDKTIDENACRMAGSSKVIARIEELTNELKERNMVTVEKVVAEWSKIAFSDIKDFLTFRTGKTFVEHRGERYTDTAHIVELKDSEEVDGTLINEVSISKDGTMKFKLHDKKAALDALSRYLGIYKDNLAINGSVPVRIVDDLE